VAAVKASEVLTVWRKLHVEVDSMAAIPAYPNAEANVIKGNITSISGNATMATRVDVNQNLDDGSPMLPNPNPNVTSGRFENGTITIGSGAQATPTRNLRGNGATYVETVTGSGFNIPFVIRRAGATQASGQVIALAGTVFTVTGNLSRARAGDEFSVTGVSMVVQSVNTQNNTVTVQQLMNIPFELVDDDAATYPFNVDTFLMQDQDSSALNLFAPAYIRPTYDLGAGAKQAGFNRNIETTQELTNQLNAGRDFTSSDGYWVVYLQGSFQDVTTADDDPNSEITTGVVAGVTLSLKYDGSLIYTEAIRDVEINQQFGTNAYLRKTVVHEVGHQFGLDHPEGGIMQQGFPVPNLNFTPVSLDKLRRVNHPLR
jgi:hypothetical protein